MKVKKFYSSCVSLKYIESNRAAPLTRIINELKGWDVFGTFSPERFDKDSMLQALIVKYGVSPFFKIDVVAHPKSPNKAIIEVNHCYVNMSVDR